MPGPVDQSLQAAAAAASLGAGVVATAAVDLSVYWIGVPMPVVLAAFAGSCCALSFLPKVGRGRAMTIVVVCTLIGAYTQPLFGIATGLPALALAFTIGGLAHIVGTSFFTEAPNMLKQAFAALIERLRGSP